MNNIKYHAIPETKSVKTLVAECKSKHFDLKPPYQRGKIWDPKDKQGFIDSVFRGIVPNPIIINVEENGKLTCIDGKQRLTTLKEFLDNKFCFKYCNDDDNDNCINIYYSKIEDPQHQNNPEYRILSTVAGANELSYFDNRSIPIIKYTHLTYADQIDIFNRIQNGKKLTTGEIIMSIFPTDRMSESYKKFIDAKIGIITKYVKKDKERSGNILLLTDIVFLLEDKKICKNKNVRETFLKRFETLTKLNDMLKRVSPVIELYFSKDLLNNVAFTKTKIQCISESMLLKTILQCEKYQSINTDIVKDIKNLIISTLTEYINSYKLQKKKKKNESTFFTILDLKLKSYHSDQNSSNDDDIIDNDEEYYNEDDNTENSESEKTKVPPKKQNRLADDSKKTVNQNNTKTPNKTTVKKSTVTKSYGVI